MKTFYIDPNGDDQIPLGPWKSLEGARSRLRVLRSTGDVTGEVEVIVANGKYEVDGPVVFGPDDGFTTYRAEHTGMSVIDGGRTLTGWVETVHSGRRAWLLSIPECENARWTFHSLFVDGKRRPRARLPKFSPDRYGVQNTYRLGEIRFPERRGLFEGDHWFKPKEGEILDWPSLRHADIVLLHYWVDTRLTSPYFEAKTGWVSCQRRSVFNLYESFNPLLARYYIDNLYEGLTDPGEWYLDSSTGVVTYLPFDDESLDSCELVAPVIDRFIEVVGDAYRHGNAVHNIDGTRAVENLSFVGLTFQNTDWYAPTGEYIPHDESAARVRDIPLGSSPQGAVHVPSVISFRWASNCRFEQNVVQNTGFSAVEFAEGCTHCECTNNELLHLGGGGIKIGGSELDGPIADRTGQIRVSDNRIQYIGRVFHQSIGVLLTNAYRCSITRNEIANTCYTGISVGWSWGYRDTITRDILIEDNHLHDICEGVLSDNGGIYLLGVQPGTVVRGNHIYRVSSADYGGWGIYADEGSSHLVVEQNWVHDTGGAGFNVHYGREIVFRNNVLARTKEGFICVGRGEGHVAVNAFHNIFVGPADAIYLGAYRGDIRESLIADANLLWFQGEEPPPCTHPDFRKDVPQKISWQEWLESGNDRNSVIADPSMIESEGSPSFRPDSPALSIGFRPKLTDRF